MQPPMIGAAIEQVFAHHAFAPRQVYAALNTAHHVFAFCGGGSTMRTVELVLVRLDDHVNDSKCDDEKDELQLEITSVRPAPLTGKCTGITRMPCAPESAACALRSAPSI